MYALCLVMATACMVLLDWRYRLAWFWQPKQALLYIALGMAFFLLWDIAGIMLDVFSTNPQWVSGLYIGTPNLPVEEIGFLFFFNYFVLCCWRLSCIRMR